MVCHGCDQTRMNESIPLPVFIKNIQAGFKYAMIRVKNCNAAESGKALNKNFF